MNNLQPRAEEPTTTTLEGFSGTSETRPGRPGQPFPQTTINGPVTTSQPSAGRDAQPAIRHGRLADLRPDARNPNAGTERGRAMVEDSLRRFGAGRSILVDRYGRIVAGNHVAEVAAEIGLEDCIVVPTDGRQLVVVQRTDLDLDSPAARALAVADNRTSEVGLSWDSGALAELAADDTIDLSMMFSNVELADLLGSDAPTPRFQPEQPEHRLDELADNITCPVCGHSWHQEAR